MEKQNKVFGVFSMHNGSMFGLFYNEEEADSHVSGSNDCYVKEISIK